MTGSSVLFDAPGPKARRNALLFSILAGVILAAGLVWLIVTLASPRQSGGIVLPGYFDPKRWDVFVNQPEVWRYILVDGMLGTLKAALVAAVLAFVFGVILSFLRSSAISWVRLPAAVFIEFVRGMPVLLMMFFIFVVAATGAFWAVVIALVVYNGAVIGEALRAGLASLPKGQREAGLSLGLRPLQTRMLIEFPQAFRQMLPIIIAQVVVLLKDTSLGYIVAYPELLRVTLYNLNSFLGNNYLFSLFIISWALYLIMNLSLSAFARWLARRRQAKGSSTALPVLGTTAVSVANAAAASNVAKPN